jgi:hypothetical protein
MRFISSTFLLELFVALPGLIVATALGTATFQPVPVNWDNLKALTPNQTVRVNLKDGRVCLGEIELMTSDAVVVRVGRQKQTLAKETILSVYAKGESQGGQKTTTGALFPWTADEGSKWTEAYRAPAERGEP